ncbi:MAG: acetate--CoA ligase family protein, partial [Minwuiales bacterium]|nr:acetate--CoA ligase family protein [Minwuiales bacterium]
NSTLSQPLVFGTGGAPEAIDPVIERLEREGVACYTAPDRTTRAVSAMVEDARARHRRLAGGVGRATADVTVDLHAPMDEDRAKSLLEAIGIAAPRRFVCRNRSEAQNALRAIGGRVVAKILDASIAHKTEVGGVQVGIETDAQLDTALDRLDAVPTRETRRYLVEAEAPPGLELILGGTNDPSFGATVLVGLGGTAAEAMGDVAIALAPLSDAEAHAMLDRLRGKTLLDGWRGAPAVDGARIVTAVTALGDLLSANPGIREIDLNPVRVYPDGLLALDALIVPSEV